MKIALSLRPENSLTSGLLRREGRQLGLIAAGTALALLFDSRPLSVIAGIVDIGGCLLAAVAMVVAWRVSGRGRAPAVYAVAVLAFALLAVMNLRH